MDLPNESSPHSLSALHHNKFLMTSSYDDFLESEDKENKSENKILRNVPSNISPKKSMSPFNKNIARAVGVASSLLPSGSYENNRANSSSATEFPERQVNEYSDGNSERLSKTHTIQTEAVPTIQTEAVLTGPIEAPKVHTISNHHHSDSKQAIAVESNISQMESTENQFQNLTKALTQDPSLVADQCMESPNSTILKMKKSQRIKDGMILMLSGQVDRRKQLLLGAQVLHPSS